MDRNAVDAPILDIAHAVSKIFVMRDRLTDFLTFRWQDKRVEAREFELFLEEVGQQLPQTIPAINLEQSLTYLAGELLTRDVLFQAAWQLAGNVQLLKSRPVYPWSHQKFLEWVPVQIMAARPVHGKRKPGFEFRIKVLAGTSSGLNTLRYWSNRHCRWLSRDLGFLLPIRVGSRKRVVRQYTHPSELVTLRFSALMDAKFSASSPGFNFVRIGAASQKYNLNQLRYRDRYEAGYSCPRDFPQSVLCYRCVVGYRNCRAATHRLDYEQRDCAQCGEYTWFDMDLAEDRCIRCCYDADQVS